MGRVFLNGCFDLLHCGHLRLIQFAKRQGEYLIVGLNSDESVRRAKGPTRPIIQEAERLEMLYGVGVNSVIVFDEPTPIELVKNIRPDVVVVSHQYGTDCESCQHVRSYGGSVVKAPQFGDVSTTQIIERILYGSS